MVLAEEILSLMNDDILDSIPVGGIYYLNESKVLLDFTESPETTDALGWWPIEQYAFNLVTGRRYFFQILSRTCLT